MSSQEKATVTSHSVASSSAVKAPQSSDSAAAPSSSSTNPSQGTSKQHASPEAIVPGQSATHQAASVASTPTSTNMKTLLDRKAARESKLEDLHAQLALLVASSKLPSGLSMPAHLTDEQKAAQALSTASVVVKGHIDHLHRYNEIKDIGLGLMGLVAEQRGVRQITVLDEFGISSKD